MKLKLKAQYVELVLLWFSNVVRLPSMQPCLSFGAASEDAHWLPRRWPDSTVSVSLPFILFFLVNSSMSRSGKSHKLWQQAFHYFSVCYYFFKFLMPPFCSPARGLVCFTIAAFIVILCFLPCKSPAAQRNWKDPGVIFNHSSKERLNRRSHSEVDILNFKYCTEKSQSNVTFLIWSLPLVAPGAESTLTLLSVCWM